LLPFLPFFAAFFTFFLPFFCCQTVFPIFATKLLKQVVLETTSDGRRRRTSSTLSDVDGRPVWMKALLSSARNWRSIIPAQLRTMRRTAENIKDPLFR